MDLFLNESRGRLQFKEMLGQANHLIVTALVGLEAVESGLITAAPPDLRAAWSPKNVVNSARRSRRLILDMVLVRAVDAVDVYIRSARRSPSLIQNEMVRNRIDAAGRSVMQKVLALEDAYGESQPVTFSLVFVMIAWRNKSAHHEADTIVEERHRRILKENATQIASNYRNLDVDRLLDGFDESEPTFKECASLISAAQNFVAGLENELFAGLDEGQYLRELIHKSPTELSGDSAQAYRKKRIQSVWGRDPSDRTRAVIRHLRQFGISDQNRAENRRLLNNTTGGSLMVAKFPSALIAKLCEMTPNEVNSWLEE
ncbi:hypothetical protein [Qipengyuania mesophila]|uniref:hypothetical protein n=1 Tax=Qipengyuania mesophila TaxID=2867246 RepID=UPI003516475B